MIYFSYEVDKLLKVDLKKQLEYGIKNREFSYYSQPVVIESLKYIGIDLTKATILRFVQNGYTFAPKRREVERGDGRIFYNPLSIIEIATASLLFKGDFLSPNSEARITRFTGEDLFVARLLFYSKYHDKFDNYFILFYNTYSNCYVQDSDSDRDTLKMSIAEIGYYIEHYNKNRLIKFDNDKKLLDVYNNFLSYTYEKTFFHLYEKYNRLLTIRIGG